jgi:ELWxxDGT repeat protein
MVYSLDHLYFAATNGSDGIELWKSDGTNDGTEMVMNINPTGDSNPKSIVEMNGYLYFSADDGTYGQELWQSDGTAANTHIVSDIYDTIGKGSDPDYLTVMGDVIYFSASAGFKVYELWRSDGTHQGTSMVKQIGDPWWGFGGGEPRELTIFKNKLFFTIEEEVSRDRELWVSDGTEEGTVIVKDLAGSSSSYPHTLTVVGDQLYFIANGHPTYGYELYVTDGTSENTKLVKLISPSDGKITLLTPNNGLLYFYADDGVHGHELWVTDGTSVGTSMVHDINPGASSSYVQYSTNMSAMNDDLYFVCFTPDTGCELWKATF